MHTLEKSILMTPLRNTRRKAKDTAGLYAVKQLSGRRELNLWYSQITANLTIYLMPWLRAK